MAFAASVILLFLSFSLTRGGYLIRIKNANELIEFSNNVNSGTNYEGTTVLLNSDIDFNGASLTPIGNNVSKTFLGAFDGQGYVIRNLSIKSSPGYMGLFGYSEGITIKNVVIDGSYSISSTSTNNPTIGGILGWCLSDVGECLIEGCVNMATISIYRAFDVGFAMGGIVGAISSTGYEATIKNCANYGRLGVYGTTEGSFFIGGITGVCGYNTKLKRIQNCFNYGAIEFNIYQVNTLYVGGIAGNTMEVVIENCLSAGKISSIWNTTGGIAGDIYSSSTTVSHCFWTDEAWDGNSTGAIEKGVSFVETDSSKVTSPTEALADLNTQASDNGWNKWVALHLDGGRINDLEQEELIASVEPFPEPVRIESTFLYWCTDIDCEGRYEYKTTDLSTITDLYAHYYTNQYTITFVSDGVAVKSGPLDYGSTIVYPENLTKEGYSLTGWDNGMSTVPAQNVTITAQWRINNYTLTFDFNNGEENDVRSLPFNSTIDYPDEPSKEGYSFAGWSPNPERVPADNLTITAMWTPNNYTLTFNFGNGTVQSVVVPFNNTIEYPKDVAKEGFIFNGWDRIIGYMPAEDITITAQWREKEVEHVEIVFDKKNMSEKEAEEIIKSYTDEEFVIEKIDFDSESGETIVIIKFVDTSKTSEFVRHINEHKKPEDSFIKSANGVDYKGSFSSILSPLLFFYLI